MPLLLSIISFGAQLHALRLPTTQAALCSSCAHSCCTCLRMRWMTMVSFADLRSSLSVGMLSSGNAMEDAYRLKYCSSRLSASLTADSCQAFVASTCLLALST